MKSPIETGRWRVASEIGTPFGENKLAGEWERVTWREVRNIERRDFGKAASLLSVG